MGKGGGGGGAEMPQQLVNAQVGMINTSNRLAQQSEGRESDVFGQMQQGLYGSGVGRTNVTRGILPLQDTLISQGHGLISDASGLSQEGMQRRAAEEAILANQMSTPQAVQNLGNRAETAGRQYSGNLFRLSPQFQSQLNMSPIAGEVARTAQGMSALSPQFQDTYNVSPIAGGVARTAQGMSALSPQFQDTYNVSPFVGGAARSANNLNVLGNQTLGELSPLRSDSLGMLSDVMQGQEPAAVSALFDDSGTAARDMLELQSRNARQRLIESSPTQGGGLDRNLAGLEASRMFGLVDIEQNIADQKRNLYGGLLDTAMGQGLSAPEQYARLSGQSADTLGLAGNLGLAGEQARQSGLGGALSALNTTADTLGLAGNLGLAGEQARQSGLGGALSALNTTADTLGLSGNLGLAGEQARQSGLGGALSAMTSAADQDYRSILANQQAQAQSQQLAQALAGQFGQGGDQLRLAAPSLIGQGAGLLQGGTVAPAIPAQIAQGMNLTPAASYLGPAMQSTQGLISADMQGQLAAQQAAAQNNAGMGQLIGTLGAGAMMAFT